SSGLFIIVVEHLQFAHPNVRRVPLSRIADRQSIIASGWQLEFQSDNEILILRFGVDRSTFARTTGDGAVLHLVLIDWSRPTLKIFAVKHGFKARRVLAAQQFVCLIRPNFADEKIAPADLTAVRLQLQWPFRRDR